MKIVVLLLGLVFCILLETTFIALPLVLFWLLLMVIFIQEEWVLFVALLVGLLLDILEFSRLGMHSLFFLVFCFIIFLYEQKFEISNIKFIVSMSFLGTFFYLLFFGNLNFLGQLLTNVFLSGLFFLLFSSFKIKIKKEMHIDLLQ